MSKLGAEAYREGKPLLVYKDTVRIPSLGMIDDILTMNKCGIDSVMSNATTNSFVESKRLKFSENKCSRIHVGNSKIDKCKEIKVHDKVIQDSKREKYLGDIITNNGRNDANIAVRKAKGFVIAGDILSILDEVPLGTHRIEAGIVMRNGMLINGILTNSEVWNGLTEKDCKEPEMVDEYFIRGIIKSYSKN